jgi:hypothetical protein
MSLKSKSLGTITGSNTSGLSVSGATNATPIVVTLGAGHGLVNGDRIHVSGITGNTAANGEWTLNFTGANTAQLLGSKGNGTYGGTPVVNVICDVTPFQANHRVAAIVGAGLTAGTIEIEGHPGDESSAGVLDTAKWVKASKTSDATILPDIVGGTVVECQLYKFMRVKAASALTGSAKVQLLS